MFDYLVCGLGSMGSAIASILKSAGKDFSVLESLSSAKKCSKKGYRCLNVSELKIKKNLIVFVCYPDIIAEKTVWPETFNNENVFFVCMTGWPVTYCKWPPKSNVLMYAPKAIASKLEKKQFMVAFAVCQKTNMEIDPIKQLDEVFEPKKSLEVSAVDEMRSDLLSEQLVLCGWGPLVSLLTYRKLVEVGVPKELAWEECVREAAYIFETLASLGPEKFSQKISSLALRGGYEAIKNFPFKHWDEMVDKMYKNIENENIVNSTDSILPPEKDAKEFWRGLDL